MKNTLLNSLLALLFFSSCLSTDVVAQEKNLSADQSVQPLQLLKLFGSEFKDDDLVTIKSVGFIGGFVIYIPIRKKPLKVDGIPPLQYLATLKKYADSGIVESQYEYAMELFLGEILPISRGTDSAALAYALRAVQKGHVGAKILVFKMLYMGRGVPKANSALALSQLEIIASVGNEDAKEAIAELKSEEKEFLARLNNMKPLMFDPSKLVVIGMSYCPNLEKKYEGGAADLLDYRLGAKNLRTEINKMMDLDGSVNLFSKIDGYNNITGRASLVFKSYENKTKDKCLTKEEFMGDLNLAYSVYLELVRLNEKLFPSR